LFFFPGGFDHVASNIDLNVVRLCFQVFLPDATGKVTRVVPPVASHPIHDKSEYAQLEKNKNKKTKKNNNNRKTKNVV
jgi:hypothetical protein